MQPGVTQAGSQRSDAEVGSRPGTVGLIGQRRSDFHRRRVNDVDGLAALSAVAAGVGGGGRVEAPGGSELHGLVGAAAIDDWGCGVNDVDRLAALGAVAAGVSGRPGSSGVKSIAAVTGGVGHRADERDGNVGPTVVGGGGLVE